MRFYMDSSVFAYQFTNKNYLQAKANGRCLEIRDRCHFESMLCVCMQFLVFVKKFKRKIFSLVVSVEYAPTSCGEWISGHFISFPKRSHCTARVIQHFGIELVTEFAVKFHDQIVFVYLKMACLGLQLNLIDFSSNAPIVIKMHRLPFIHVVITHAIKR